jgi:hypothetical protein
VTHNQHKIKLKQNTKKRNVVNAIIKENLQTKIIRFVIIVTMQKNELYKVEIKLLMILSDVLKLIILTNMGKWHDKFENVKLIGGGEVNWIDCKISYRGTLNFYALLFDR